MKSPYAAYAAAWFDTARAMNAAATTIFMRTLAMQQDMAAGRFGSGPEYSRMSTEKWQAASDGSFAAAREWTQLWWKTAAAGPLAFRPMTAEAMGAASTRLAMAAVRPGFAAARANARRLTPR